MKLHKNNRLLDRRSGIRSTKVEINVLVYFYKHPEIFLCVKLKEVELI